MPGQRRGGGFPGFLPLFPALTFLAGLIGLGHIPRADRSMQNARTGGGAQGRGRGRGQRRPRSLQGHPWGAAPCVTWHPPCEGRGAACCKLRAAVVELDFRGCVRRWQQRRHPCCAAWGPGDGRPVREPWRAVGAHAAVRPAAHASGRAVRDPGQL